MEQAIRIIKQFGFPVFVCLILFYIVFISLANNTRAVDNLTTAIYSKLPCLRYGGTYDQDYQTHENRHRAETSRE